MFCDKYKKQLLDQESELKELRNIIEAFESRYKNVINIDDEIKLRDNQRGCLNKEIDTLTLEKTSLESQCTKLSEELRLYEETLDITSFGLYNPIFQFDTAEEFKKAILDNYEKQKVLIKNDTAAVLRQSISINGNVAEGKKAGNNNKKLMLFAFNGECDSLISKVKWNNVVQLKEKINKVFSSINKLGELMAISISTNYLELKIEQLHLAYEYENKKYQEKEEQRLIREQMKEEERALRELEKAKKDAEEEEKEFQRDIEKTKEIISASDSDKVAELNLKLLELEKKLEEARFKKERAIAQAQLTKVGYIYVISNIGSFGDNVYKIGMTRRLDPYDRIRELGDASVPFQFDVHAVIYSDNAPQLEYELHKKFSAVRVNQLNARKEFFKVTLEEIEVVVKSHLGAEISFTKIAEAIEYRQTQAISQSY